MPHINIITGASSGLGKCLVAEYSARGETVIGVVRDLAALSKVKDLSKNKNIIFVVADLSKPDFIQRIINAIPPDTKIQGVVHCAAILGPVGVAAELKGKEAEIDKAMMVNCNAPIALTKALLKFYTDDTRILFIGSDYANPSKDPRCFEIYAQSKKALYTHVSRLREELKLTEKISINIFNPGPTDTSLFAEFWDHIDKRYGKSISPSKPSSPAKVAESLINFVQTTSNEIFSRKEEWRYGKLNQPPASLFFEPHQLAFQEAALQVESPVAQSAAKLTIRARL